MPQEPAIPSLSSFQHLEHCHCKPVPRHGMNPLEPDV